MKKHKNKAEKPRTLKRKLMSALCMLLISTVLLAATSYAWIVLSTAPEVTGITTNVGANGALEIALLTGETRQDLSKIRSTIGDSLANDSKAANNNWGNMIDLSIADYGLGEVVLLPARINLGNQLPDGSYMVNSGLLAVPTYGYDGRIMELDYSPFTAAYDGDAFSYAVGTDTPDYGVRAIGTSDTLSVQASALAMAKSNISTYTKNANSTAANSLSKNGSDLFGMVLTYSANRSATFSDANLATIKAMITDLSTSMNYIDLALRQGLVAVAASKLDDEDTFKTTQDLIMATNVKLSEITAQLPPLGEGAIPPAYSTWINKAEDALNSLNAAENACNALTGGSYTWEQLKEPLNYIMNMDLVYINDKLFSEFDSSSAGELMTTGAKLTLASGSGVFADVADFADDYSTAFTAVGVAVEITTLSTVENGPYLTVLSNTIKDWEAADGSGSGVQKAELSSTYGYALDMAFRCNAAGTSNLLLQTAAVQRVYGDSTSPSTMGGGSYMEFSANDSSLSLDQMLRLMDAVRVAFIDDQGILLKVAKLNTSNRTVTDGVVKAPLYLYEYSFSEEDGSMIMGERQKGDNAITSLDQNAAKAVTTVVWLDGDVVDNTMVSATKNTSLTGVLNLQFATDADLVPAGNAALMNATVDKTELKDRVESNELTYNAGQGIYTTVSWNAFADAYVYASAINESLDATEAQVRIASANLALASANLQPVSHEALTAKIFEVRSMMGETADLAAYVVYDEVNDIYVAVDPYTQEQQTNKKGEIFRVDYENNLNDEGSGVFTPIYTDESWFALAAALYSAEAVDLYDGATDAQLDAAIIALDTAYNNLQHRLFYSPYEYEGSIYYYAIPRTGETAENTQDTYGRWYDSQFKRITSDLAILNLDARAEIAEIAYFEQYEFITNLTSTITPYVVINEELYPAMRDEEIIAVQWSIPERLFVRAITSAQIAALNGLKAEAEALNVDGDTTKQVDAALIAQVETAVTAIGENTLTAEEAEELIDDLQAAVEAATPETSPSLPAIPPAVQIPAPMTADQVTVLTKAVNTAKTVDGYDTPSDGESEDPNAAKLEALRAATTEVEALLAQETGATAEEADTKLAALNDALTALGVKEVTAYNTLQYSIPVGSEWKEVVYGVEMPYIPLKAVGELGTDSISAVVLTKNGIVFTAELDVEVYSPAADVEVIEPADAPVGGAMESVGNGEDAVIEWNNKIQANAATFLSAELVNRQQAARDKDGNIQMDDDGNIVYEEIVNTETIKKYTWASSDTEVLTVSNEETATCTVNAVAEGTANVTLSVTTVQGNIYTDSITITVTADSNAEGGSDIGDTP